jgi:hypothetical protein
MGPAFSKTVFNFFHLYSLGYHLLRIERTSLQVYIQNCPYCYPLLLINRDIVFEYLYVIYES